MNNLKSTFERLDILANPKSDRVKKIAGLSRRSVRKKYGSLLVEGLQNFKELIADESNSKYIKDIYLSDSLIQKRPDYYEKALDLTMWVHVCADEVIQAMSKDAQGVVCVLKSSLFITDISTVDLTNVQTVAILPQIQDPGNLGTIIRSADAFGADLVVVCKNSVDVTSPKVIRSCAGSVFHIPIIYDVDFKEIVRACKKADISVLGTSGDEQAYSLELLIEDYFERKNFERNSTVPIKLERSTCWVFGNEAQGLTQHEKDICDGIVKIDMPGLAESLNVSVAASLCLHASALVKNI